MYLLILYIVATENLSFGYSQKTQISVSERPRTYESFAVHEFMPLIRKNNPTTNRLPLHPESVFMRFQQKSPKETNLSHLFFPIHVFVLCVCVFFWGGCFFPMEFLMQSQPSRDQKQVSTKRISASKLSTKKSL